MVDLLVIYTPITPHIYLYRDLWCWTTGFYVKLNYIDIFWLKILRMYFVFKLQWFRRQGTIPIRMVTFNTKSTVPKCIFSAVSCFSSISLRMGPLWQEQSWNSMFPSTTITPRKMVWANLSVAAVWPVIPSTNSSYPSRSEMLLLYCYFCYKGCCFFFFCFVFRHLLYRC